MRLGVISEKEAAESSQRNVLSRSLGMNLFVNIDVDEVTLLAGDVLLLCSDGLHGAVSAAEMAETTRRHRDLAAAARDLVDRANELDGSDNVSVQIIRVRSVERVGMYRGRPYKLR